jgi:hypothetical protein
LPRTRRRQTTAAMVAIVTGSQAQQLKGGRSIQRHRM